MENTKNGFKGGRGFLLAPGFIVVVFILSLVICRSADKPTKKISKEASALNKVEQIPDQVKQPSINYEIFRNYGPGARKVILVSEKATKEEVLTLAYYLKTLYMTERNGRVFIQIFDSKEAFLNQTNPKYPEKKLFKHMLVDAGNNPSTGASWLDWVAVGRDH